MALIFLPSELIKLHSQKDKGAIFELCDDVTIFKEPWKYHDDDAALKLELIDEAKVQSRASLNHKSKWNSAVLESLHDFLMKSCCLVLAAYGLFMYNVPLNWYWRCEHLRDLNMKTLYRLFRPFFFPTLFQLNGGDKFEMNHDFDFDVWIWELRFGEKFKL